MIISIIDHLHQNACEIDYLNSRNNRISVTPEIDLYIGDSTFRREEKRMITFAVPSIHSRAQRDGIHDATSESHD